MALWDGLYLNIGKPHFTRETYVNTYYLCLIQVNDRQIDVWLTVSLESNNFICEWNEKKGNAISYTCAKTEIEVKAFKHPFSDAGQVKAYFIALQKHQRIGARYTHVWWEQIILQSWTNWQNMHDGYVRNQCKQM